MVESSLAEWRGRIRHRISQRIPPSVRHDNEVEQRLQALLNAEVPSDAELIAMQQRGELASDEELARDMR
jgi:hypothetical protein